MVNPIEISILPQNITKISRETVDGLIPESLDLKFKNPLRKDYRINTGSIFKKSIDLLSGQKNLGRA